MDNTECCHDLHLQVFCMDDLVVDKKIGIRIYTLRMSLTCICIIIHGPNACMCVCVQVRINSHVDVL